ncbi:MAG: branched-chain amino acid transport system substrate-binding protein [Bradyrhizobium sp.]|jgi:branched-chain amino acid transport system substrate-binding protein
MRLSMVFGAALLTSCLISEAQAQIGPFKTIHIGVSGPFSGGSAPIGLSMRNGIRLAIDEINQVGGIGGQQFELIEFNDEAKEELGAKIADELIRQRVTATIGVVNTGVGMVTIDAYQKAGVPLLVAVSTGPELTKRYAPPAASINYIFRVSPTADLEVRALVAELKRNKTSSVSWLVADSAYGNAGTKVFKHEIGTAGIKLSSEDRFQVGDKDMRAQVVRAMASGSQAVVVWGSGPELGVIAKHREAFKWKVPMLTSWTSSSRNFIETSGKAGEGIMMPQTFIQDMGSTSKNGFLLSYGRMFKTDVLASPMGAAQGYDGMHLLYRAIRQANSGDGSKIRAALENLDTRYQGVITSYSHPFSSNDHDAITLNMLWIGRIVNGRVEYAYREDQRRDALLRFKAH